MPLPLIPETDEYKEDTTLTKDIKQEKTIQLLKSIDKIQAKQLINKMGLQVQRYNKDIAKRAFYMAQLQRLFNAYAEIYNQCPFGNNKLTKK